MGFISKGLGDCSFRTVGVEAINKLTIPYAVYTYNFTKTSEGEPAQAYRAGERVDEELFTSSTSYTLTLSTQINTEATDSLLLDEFKRTITDFTLPTVGRGKVPASAPYEIPDPRIVTGNLDTVTAGIDSAGAWGAAGPLTKVSVAPTTTRQYQATAGKLVFHSSQAGATVTYVLDREIASASVWGGPGVSTPVGDLEFVGEEYTTGGKSRLIWIPQIKRNTDEVTIEYSGDIPEISIGFIATVPAGWEKAYMLVDLDSIIDPV